MPQKVYISGPISGLNKDYVDKRFSDAKNALIVAGMTPVSPLENGLPETASYDQHMARDIEMLSECQAIYMLDGWRKSNGCRLEMAHAIAHKKTIIFEKKQRRKKYGQQQRIYTTTTLTDGPRMVR